MMIAHPYYFDPIEITSECPKTLVIERGDYLRTVVLELLEQQKTSTGRFVVSCDSKIYDFSKTVFLMTDIFDYDLDNRTFKSRIQSYLADVSVDSEKGARLITDIKNYAFELCESGTFPMTFDSDLTINDLIKFLDFRFYPEVDSPVETICEYLFGITNILGRKLCITVNLKNYMNAEEYNSFIELIRYKNIELLMIERHIHEDMDNPAWTRIIDKDLCVID